MGMIHNVRLKPSFDRSQPFPYNLQQAARRPILGSALRLAFQVLALYAQALLFPIGRGVRRRHRA